MAKPADLYHVGIALLLTGIGVYMKKESLEILCFGSAVLVILIGAYRHTKLPQWKSVIAALLGGVVVILATIFIQRFRSIPNDRTLLTVIGLISAGIIYLLGLVRNTAVQKPSSPDGQTPHNSPDTTEVKQLRDRIEELERENAALEKAREYASNLYDKVRGEKDILQGSLTNKINYLESHQWLFDIAERDKREIDKYVVARDPVVYYTGLSDDVPYFIITFKVFNYSVHPISIDPKDVKGSIYRNEKELSGNLKMEGDVVNLSRDGSHWELAVKQWVDPKEAELLLNPLLDIKLKFDKLTIIIKGGDGTSGIEPKRLKLPSAIPVAETQPPNLRVEELKGRIEELKAENERLKKQRPPLTFDIDTMKSRVKLDETPFGCVVVARIRMSFYNSDLHPLTVMALDLTIHGRDEAGATPEIEAELLANHVFYPDDDLGPLTRKGFEPMSIEGRNPPAFYWYSAELSIDSITPTDFIGKTPFLRMTMKAPNQHPFPVVMDVDWGRARIGFTRVLVSDA